MRVLEHDLDLAALWGAVEVAGWDAADGLALEDDVAAIRVDEAADEA